MKTPMFVVMCLLGLAACQQEPEAPAISPEDIKAVEMKPGELNIEQIPPSHQQLEKKDRELTAEVMRQAKYVDLKPVGAPAAPAGVDESKVPSNADTAP